MVSIYQIMSFETIRNNTALKLTLLPPAVAPSFETIRNNTALKHAFSHQLETAGFETIRNNTALKRKALELSS